MAKVLTVRNAEIHTATIEIKTLTLSGKQITLAVFRQLLRETLIDGETGYFTGQPWGVVNYHPDRCADDPKHIHVVWQHGSELRRDNVFAPYSGPYFTKLLSQWVSLRLINGPPLPVKVAVDIKACAIALEVNRLHCWDNASVNLMEALGGLGERSHPSCALARLEQDCTNLPPLSEVTNNLKDVVNTVKERRGQYRERWEELHYLPQLFIAV